MVWIAQSAGARAAALLLILPRPLKRLKAVLLVGFFSSHPPLTPSSPAPPPLQVLGRLLQFRDYYLEQRRLQVTNDLQPPHKFLESYQPYLAQVRGRGGEGRGGEGRARPGGVLPGELPALPAQVWGCRRGAGGWGEDQALCHQPHDRSGLLPRSWGNWQPLRPPYSLTLCPISVGDGFLRGRVICGAAGSGAHHPGAGKQTSNDMGGWGGSRCA